MSVWDPLIGSPAVQSLADQVATGEIPHAWLFEGPAGAGKRSTATAMAAALNCVHEPFVGCGRCTSCTRIVRHRYPDVHHIAPEGPLIPVDLIREVVIPEAARSPFEGRTKVFIIEEADRMNEPAQNALLKTLEEPVEDTVFLLISERPDDLLDTVRSRCRHIRLEPVPEARIIEMLVKEGATQEAAANAARVSDGDFETARALALDAAAAERRALWLSIPARLRSPVDGLDAAAEILEEARSAVKERESTQREEVVELAEAMGEGRGTAGARNALARKHRRELRRLEEDILGSALKSIASFYRDVLAARSGHAEAVVNRDLLDEIQVWASSPMPDASFVAAIEICLKARESFTWNANQTLAIESTLAQLSRLVPGPTPTPST